MPNILPIPCRTVLNYQILRFQAGWLELLHILLVLAALEQQHCLPFGHLDWPKASIQATSRRGHPSSQLLL